MSDEHQPYQYIQAVTEPLQLKDLLQDSSRPAKKIAVGPSSSYYARGLEVFCLIDGINKTIQKVL